MPRYRTINNDLSINVDGRPLAAGSDGVFDVPAGSRAEQVLLAGGAYRIDGSPIAPSASHTEVLNGAVAGQSSGWLPLAPYPEFLEWALDAGGSTAGFSIDVSADGITALAQTHTGTATSSTIAERYWFSPTSPQARYFRVTVLSGGAMSMNRGA